MVVEILFKLLAQHSTRLFCSVIILYACSCNENKIPGKATGNKKVEIIKENGKFTLYRNGQPFLIKGAVGNGRVAELAACGGNTISLWDTLRFEQIFNEAAKHNIAVIAGLDIPGGENDAFYSDAQKTDELFARYSYIVKKYKKHPSLLAWILGNELKMPFSANSSSFYKTYNRLLDMIHEQDPDHPVTTTIINYQKGSILNINWKIRNLDFISINTYNRLKEVPQQLSLVSSIWNGPFMISEWSPNGGWESKNTLWEAPLENTSTKKAEQYNSFYKKYMPLNNNRFLGSLAFFWGNRHEYTPTWYSIFDSGGSPTEIAETLSDCWNDTVTKHQAVKVKFMLIDSLGGQNNIILSPGTRHAAQIFLDSIYPASDSLRYTWAIKKEDWTHWGHTYKNFTAPAAEQGLLSDSTIKNPSFICPDKEGPYRIFVTVYNSKGYCATANTPFYIVD